MLTPRQGYCLTAQSGTDHLDGLSGNDILRGGTGADTLTGGLGTDVLQGDAGADILIGNGGNDTFMGGTGNDHFRLATGNGTETIADFSDGQDRVDLLGTLSFSKLTIVQSTTDISDTLIKLTSNNTTLAVLQNVQASSITSADFVVV